MNQPSAFVFAAELFFCLAMAAGGAPQKKHPPGVPLDLNSATVVQLQQVPGIGPTLAKRIVRLREKSGPFRRVDDLLALPRVTRAAVEKMRPYLTVAPRQ